MLVDMKTFKINKNTNVPEKIFKFSPGTYTIVTSGSGLCLMLDKEDGRDLFIGGKIRFEKTASGNSGEILLVAEKDAVITAIVEDGDYVNVFFDYLYIEPLTIARYMNITSPEDYSFKFYFTGDHGMLPGDLAKYVDYTVYVRRGANVISFGGLAFCYPEGLIRGSEILISGNCSPDVTEHFNYGTMERNSILAKSVSLVAGNMFKPEPGDQVLFATNPYFFVTSDSAGTVTLFDNVSVCKYSDFRNLGIVLEQDYDAKRMYQEYQVNELFVKKIKNSIIPGFVDLEKIKFTPAYSGETGLFLATGLTFNLHFRTRVSGETGYDFEDTWHFNDSTDTWNGNGVYDAPKKREQLYSDADFVNSSNLMGYLGFTDDDIYNQKNRVKQSFLRLLFYDGPNPLTQNLLYYSTIFMDTGELYGKFVKRKAWLEDTVFNYDQRTNPVVWYPASPDDPCDAITSQFRVNDEYDMTKSGEGFNLYLFREDAPTENTPQDIYMKVEFNHAGYGRTIPLIYWKKKNNVPVPLVIADSDPNNENNYMANLYIKLKARFTGKGYVYTFDDAQETNGSDATRKEGILWENDRLVFNLFEPMIENPIDND